jgi:hypothetical protein
MTEAEWLACTEPQDLLEVLRCRVSDRKLRLFAAACARWVWDLLPDERCRQALEVAERFADDAASSADLRKAHGMVEEVFEALLSDPCEQGAYYRQLYAVDAVLVQPEEGEPADARVHGVAACGGNLNATDAEAAKRQERFAQASLIRDIVGNPFRPVPIDPAWCSWHGGTGVRLAEAIYENRDLPSGHLDPARLATLADALEDSGYTDQDILQHCRGAGPHVRGCWVVDLLLGKV